MLYSALLATGLLLTQANCLFIDKRQQEDAVSTPQLPELTPLPWGDVNFIHSTDTHGWLEGHVLQGSYNGDLGDFYSFSVRMKEKARELKKDLFIVDTGDTHDGDGLSDVTDPKGKVTLPLIANIPYDILTIGNHELYVDSITNDTVHNFIPHWKDRYLAANVYFKDVNSNKTTQIGNKYTYFEGEFGTRVLAYGFLFNFKGNGNNSVVNLVQDELAQPWFNQSLTEHTPDVVTLIGHIGIRFEEFHAIIRAVRAYYPTIPITVLGGHTHIRDFTVYDGRAAGIESGRYMETIGFFSVEGISNNDTSKNLTFSRRYLDQNRQSYIYHSVDDEKKFDTEKGQEMSKKIFKLRKKLQLSQHLGCAPQNYTLNSVPVTNNSSLYHLITNVVLPETIGDKSSKNKGFYLYNTGGIRYDIYQGPFTLSQTYQIAPFENYFYCIYNVPLSVAQKMLPIMNKEGELKKRWFSSHALNAVEFEMANTTLTPGYVTQDDYGTGGDDTPHTAIPYYDARSFVGSELPEGDDSTMVDVIYLDFFDKQLRELLNGLTGSTWTANTTFSSYTGNTVWPAFVKEHWSKCP